MILLQTPIENYRRLPQGGDLGDSWEWLMFEGRMKDEYWGEGSLLGVGALLWIWMLQACLLEVFLCGLELAKLRVSLILGFGKHIDSLTRILKWLGKLAQPPAVSESWAPSKKISICFLTLGLPCHFVEGYQSIPPL